MDNDSWAVKEEVAEQLKNKLLFPLKWKHVEGGKKESVTKIKHGAVVSQTLDTDAPKHSCLVLQYITTKHWKVFVADVKSAFLQADDHLRVSGEPNVDIRKWLERVMELQNEITQMRKPAFGDVSEPGVWNKSA